MPTRSLDILLRYLLDKSALNEASAGTKKLASDMASIERVTEAADKAYADLERRLKSAASVKEVKSIERQFREVEKAVNDTSKAYSNQARILRAEAAAISSDLQQARVSQLNNISAQIGGISRAALGIGVGAIGGIFAAASKYVKDAKEATEATRAWAREQKRLEESGRKIGAVLVEEALPMLRQAADLAAKTADFVEDNPEIIQAALNTGLVLATLGAVGIAVSKGIKLYADIQTLLTFGEQLTAAKMQDLAADKQLAAARLRAGTGNGSIPTAAAAGSGALGGVALVASMVAAVLATAAIAGAAKILIDKIFPDTPETAVPTNSTTGIGSPELRRAQGALANAIQRGDSEEDIAKLREEVKRLGQQAYQSALEVEGATETISSSLSAADSPAFDQLIAAYEDYKRDDLELVRNHYQERQGIIADALAAEQAANKRYADSVAKVNANTSGQLAKLAGDFERNNQRAEQQYQDNRAKIIRDGAEDIEKIQKESQERIRKLTQDHNDRVGDLTAARDALGLAKENRDFRRAVNEEKRDASREVRERRQEIQQRLADLQRSYEQERAQRLADYQARVAEVRAQAVERLKELALEHQEEIKRIRAQKAEKLREVDQQFAEERRRRYQMFVQQVRDLDASLLNETNLKRAYYNRMLLELDTFLASYRARMGSLAGAATSASPTSPTGMATGGYAGYGVYKLGDNLSGGPGGAEYILSNQTVKAAENVIGGKLTQEGILAAMRGGGGGRSASIVWNDHRRFDSRLSAEDRRAITQDTERILREAVATA